MVVIGVESNNSGLNCGFCGKPSCQALEEANGVCAFNSIDLGIATASAAEVAGRFHIDNRVMSLHRTRRPGPRPDRPQGQTSPGHPVERHRQKPILRLQGVTSFRFVKEDKSIPASERLKTGVFH